jgi:cyclic pyranopterin monophosphate synthase
MERRILPGLLRRFRRFVLIKTSAAVGILAVSQFSHLNQAGDAHMVDISQKPQSGRLARAEAMVRMQRDTLDAIFGGGIAKGDVLAVARIAGIQAAKRTAELIPLCHPLAISNASIEFARVSDVTLRVLAECRVTGQTGVEMEALTAASIAALTIYDMCKSADRGMTIESIRLLHKSGGKSGVWDATGIR